jgi:hypothetical protein
VFNRTLGQYPVQKLPRLVWMGRSWDHKRHGTSDIRMPPTPGGNVKSQRMGLPSRFIAPGIDQNGGRLCPTTKPMD